MSEAVASGCGGGTCGCGAEVAELPVLDARSIPRAVRHGAILGALGGLAPGAGVVLVAPHDPLPLLATVEEREPGAFDVEYARRGPDTWQLRFRRR